MTRKAIIQGIVAEATLSTDVPKLLVDENAKKLMTETAEAAMEFALVQIELAFRTGFADGMERAVGIFQRQAPPDVDSSWRKFKETL